MSIELRALSYRISREPNELVVVDVSFLLMTPPNKSKEIAEALKRIELFLYEKINLVKSDGSNRCFFCGVKQEDNAQTCTQCGAPL
jgi:zinc ribbon protein